MKYGEIRKSYERAERVIEKATRDGSSRGIEHSALNHASLVCSAVSDLQPDTDGSLDADVVERIVNETDAQMGNAGLSAHLVDTFVTVALLLIDSKRFLNHFLKVWRVRPEAHDIIDRFVKEELTLKAFVEELKPFRIRS